jgi:hypothetical protein
MHYLYSIKGFFMNMSYCRFQNTASDLEDCLEAMPEQLSAAEHKARKRLVALCQQIVDQDENDPVEKIAIAD